MSVKRWGTFINAPGERKITQTCLKVPQETIMENQILPKCVQKSGLYFPEVSSYYSAREVGNDYPSCAETMFTVTWHYLTSEGHIYINAPLSWKNKFKWCLRLITFFFSHIYFYFICGNLFAHDIIFNHRW